MQIRNRTCAWLASRENLLLLAIVLVHLVPIWAFKYFPSQDGPTHIENAKIIFDYFRPSQILLRQYYQLNFSLEPTWFMHSILGSLLSVLPVFLAEKIFLSGYVILLPLSIRYSLGSIRKDSGFLTLLMFPFIYNYPFHMGFYSFSYSLPVFFFFLGYWIRHRWERTAGNTFKLALLSLLLYLCHIVSWVMAYAAMILLTVWLMLFDLAQEKHGPSFEFRALSKAFRKEVLLFVLAFLPTIVLATIFLFQQGFDSPEIGVKLSFYRLLKDLMGIESLVSFQEEESLCSAGLGVLFAALFLALAAGKARRRRLDRWDGLLAVVLVYLLIYFFAPNALSGGSFITARLILYPFFALILWFGARSYAGGVRRGIGLAAIIVTLTSLGLHASKYSELNGYLAEYLSGMDLIQSDTTLLPLAFDSRGHRPDGKLLSLKVRPFLHAAGHIAARRQVIEFANYEAGAYSYFPVRFRSNLNPYVHIGTKERSIVWEPPRVDFVTYAGRTGGRVDYVLVWGVREHQRNQEATRSVYQQIKESYDLIYRSPRTGLMELYKRKG